MDIGVKYACAPGLAFAVRIHAVLRSKRLDPAACCARRLAGHLRALASRIGEIFAPAARDRDRFEPGTGSRRIAKRVHEPACLTGC